MDPIKILKIRLHYISVESLVLLSLVSRLVINFVISNLTSMVPTRVG